MTHLLHEHAQFCRAQRKTEHLAAQLKSLKELVTTALDKALRLPRPLDPATPLTARHDLRRRVAALLAKPVDYDRLPLMKLSPQDNPALVLQNQHQLRRLELMKAARLQEQLTRMELLVGRAFDEGLAIDNVDDRQAVAVVRGALALRVDAIEHIPQHRLDPNETIEIAS